MISSIYVVSYCVYNLKLTCGVLGTFTSLYAAQKFKERAEKALKESGQEGVISLDTCAHSHTLVTDLYEFFSEI